MNKEERVTVSMILDRWTETSQQVIETQRDKSCNGAGSTGADRRVSNSEEVMYKLKPE